ncbi:MAG: hypothetical protein K0U36_03010, partial [Alphaproteobacteria bacterium]|nr:hypothetical protein [Alphaproteobacteria bacterium]
QKFFLSGVALLFLSSCAVGNTGSFDLGAGASSVTQADDGSVYISVLKVRDKGEDEKDSDLKEGDVKTVVYHCDESGGSYSCKIVLEESNIFN